jgi:hypothetical protein
MGFYDIIVDGVFPGGSGKRAADIWKLRSSSVAAFLMYNSGYKRWAVVPRISATSDFYLDAKSTASRPEHVVSPWYVYEGGVYKKANAVRVVCQQVTRAPTPAPVQVPTPKTFATYADHVAALESKSPSPTPTQTPTPVPTYPSTRPVISVLPKIPKQDSKTAMFQLASSNLGGPVSQAHQSHDDPARDVASRSFVPGTMVLRLNVQQLGAATALGAVVVAALAVVVHRRRQHESYSAIEPQQTQMEDLVVQDAGFVASYQSREKVSAEVPQIFETVRPPAEVRCSPSTRAADTEAQSLGYTWVNSDAATGVSSPVLYDMDKHANDQDDFYERTFDDKGFV